MAITSNGDPSIGWYLEKASTEDGTQIVITARYTSIEWITSESSTTPSDDLFGHIIPVNYDRGFTLKNGERLWTRASRAPQRPIVVRT